MFKIKHYDYCDIYTKIHYVSTRKIAEEVKTNLSSRFSGIFQVTEEPENECTWDPGGMLMMHDEIFTFQLKYITVKCKAQHFDSFVNHLQTYKSNETGTQYIKIHGEWSCICLTIGEFEQLKKLVNNSVFAMKAEAAFEKREEKLCELEDNGYIQ